MIGDAAIVENYAMALEDVENTETKSPAVIKFQRTMRRLSILRRFAKSRGLEFDIENMEISLLTRPKDDGNVKSMRENYLMTDYDKRLKKK